MELQNPNHTPEQAGGTISGASRSFLASFARVLAGSLTWSAMLSDILAGTLGLVIAVFLVPALTTSLDLSFVKVLGFTMAGVYGTAAACRAVFMYRDRKDA